MEQVLTCSFCGFSDISIINEEQGEISDDKSMIYMCVAVCRHCGAKCIDIQKWDKSDNA